MSFVCSSCGDDVEPFYVNLGGSVGSPLSRMAAQSIPMWQGKVLPNDWDGDWGGFPACARCFKWQSELTEPSDPLPRPSNRRRAIEATRAIRAEEKRLKEEAEYQEAQGDFNFE